MKMFRIVMHEGYLWITDTSTMYLKGDDSPVVVSAVFGSFYRRDDLIYRFAYYEGLVD